MTKKVAIVFGGSGGIGRAVAKKLRESDIHVCSTYHQNKDEAEYQIDILDESSIRQGVESILADCGRVDIVVFSVSLPLEYKSVLASDWSDYQKHLEAQAKGLFQVVRSLTGQIKSQGGIRFVIILSEVVTGAPPAGFSSYVTAKYALLGMARCLAVELAKYKCTVNLVSPGMVETDLLKVYPPKLVELSSANNPLKRIATPQDVANAVGFFVSPESDYINGAHLTVNGGSIMI